MVGFLSLSFPLLSQQQLTGRQTDGVTRYIDWAISKDFGVIDVNVPHYITHPAVRHLCCKCLLIEKT